MPSLAEFVYSTVTQIGDDQAMLPSFSGKMVWETQVLDYRTHPALQGAGPIIGNGMAISGRSCSPRGGPDEVAWINPNLEPGEVRKVITGIPGKTALVYSIDRETGEFLWARPTVYQNVIQSIDGETGRATENPEVVFHALEEERLICPNMHGGKDWEAGAYSPETNTLYYPLRNMCMPTLTTTDPSASHTIYALSVRHEMAPGTDNLGAVYAISAETGRTVWLHEQRASTTSLVATGGGLSRKATMSMYSWALSVPGSSGGMVDRTLV